MSIKPHFLLGVTPRSSVLSKVPNSMNADLMTKEQIREELEQGYVDYECGKVHKVDEAFQKFEEKHL